jgi:hypothetical protein
MPDIRVRDIHERVVVELKAQAKRNGLTLQASLAKLLTEAAERPRKEIVAKVLAHQDWMREQCGVQPDSTPSIREERDRIG